MIECRMTPRRHESRFRSLAIRCRLGLGEERLLATCDHVAWVVDSLPRDQLPAKASHARTNTNLGGKPVAGLFGFGEAE